MSGHGEAGGSAAYYGESERLLAAAFDIPAEVGEREAQAWHAGAAGERRTARLLGRLPPGWHVWHDLAVPRSRANIDHLALGPGGLYLIDSKMRRYPRPLDAEERVAEVTLGIAARISERLLPAGAPARGAGGTVFGTSVGRPFNASLREQDAKYGRLQVLRIFYPGPPDRWATMPAAHAGRPLVVSFKENPATILSGRRDGFYRTWFVEAPADRDIWWVYWHEPEDEIAAGMFTAADYRAAFAHLDALANPAQARNPRLHTTQVLMDWTLAAASGRNWRDYYPGPAVIDVQAWDMYDWVTKRIARKLTPNGTDAPGRTRGAAEAQVRGHKPCVEGGLGSTYQQSF